MGALAREIGQERVAEITVVTDGYVSAYSALTGIRAACRVFGIPERSYRHRLKVRKDISAHESDHEEAVAGCRHCRSEPPTREQRSHPFALDIDEQDAVLDVLCSERFVDMSATQVYWQLLDEGRRSLP